MSYRNLSRGNLPFHDVYMASMDFCAPASLLLLPLGVIANIINITVFIKTGVRDNVTISSLALSVSDLAYLVIISPHVVFNSVTHLVQVRLGLSINWFIDANILWVPFYWYAFVFYDTSTLITVYISVVRCACVALPFKVKDMFTSRTAVIAFSSFFVCVFLLRLPMFIKKRFITEFDKLTNSSRVRVKEFDDGGLADTINDIVSRNVLPWTCFIIVTACLVVMVTKLRASAKFRFSMSGKDSGPMSPVTATDTKHDFDVGKESTATKDERSKDQILSSRELKILRSVILVAAIFVICQIPFMAYSLARRLETEFDDTRQGRKISKYINLFSVASSLSSFFAFVNATVNIAVYYNHNSRYRQCFQTLFKKGVSNLKVI